MVVGVCTIRLRLIENRSLKGKRRVVKTIVDRVRARFNVSIAEVDHQDLWQSAGLGVAVVSNDRAYVHSILTSVVDFIDDLHLGELVDYQIEII
jgi:hypothetical protein